MKYVASIERSGVKTGMRLGVVETTLRQLQRRFGLLDETTQIHVSALSLEYIGNSAMLA